MGPGLRHVNHGGAPFPRIEQGTIKLKEHGGSIETKHGRREVNNAGRWESLPVKHC